MSLTRGRELPIGARAGLIDPKHVKAMGSARWLYDWILWRVTSEQDGLGRVLGGSPVRCEEIAADLGVGLRTVYRWMRRLRGRYIRTRHVVAYGRHGLAIEVLRSKKFHAGEKQIPRLARDDRVGARTGNPQISTFSTASTGNPARPGKVNPANSGRENPATNGLFHKEERKPFTESYGKGNYGFLEDLPGEGKFRQAKPSHPTAREEQKPNRERCESPVSNGQEHVPWSPAPEAPDVASRQDEEGRSDGESRRAGEPCSDGGSQADSGSEVPPAANRETAAPGPGEAQKELLRELRRMIAAKSPPREATEQRRDLLERQRGELLRRAERRCMPP